MRQAQSCLHGALGKGQNLTDGKTNRMLEEGEAGAAFSANGPPTVDLMLHVQIPPISGFQLPSDCISLPFVAIAQLLSQGLEKKILILSQGYIY